MARILLTIGHDDKDDAGRPLVYRHRPQPGIEIHNATTDGVKERRVRTRHKCFLGQFWNRNDRRIGVHHFVRVQRIKLHEGERDLRWQTLVLREEGIESTDRVGPDGRHTAGAVQNDRDLRAVRRALGASRGARCTGGVLCVRRVPGVPLAPLTPLAPRVPRVPRVPRRCCVRHLEVPLLKGVPTARLRPCRPLEGLSSILALYHNIATNVFVINQNYVIVPQALADQRLEDPPTWECRTLNH